jgi:fumarylacetoacetase
MNETNDPGLRSWVTSANQPGTDFPIQNCPLGIFGGLNGPSIGLAIGDRILDLRSCVDWLLPLPDEIAEACTAATLNPLMALGADSAAALRSRLSDLLRADHPNAAAHQRALQPFLTPLADAIMDKPAAIGDYTDFYASIDHARNLGSFFRPEAPLLANYKYVPIGYHGRASSIVVSGETVKRPSGQTVATSGAIPTFGPSRRLDYETEIGFFVGAGNRLGETIAIQRAAEHLFGICLLNDWSARDLQAWEYQPLGPFLAKSFATTLSPWIVTMEALAPFRAPVFVRPAEDPAPLAYLYSEQDQQRGAIDLTLETFLRSAAMGEAGMPAMRLSQTNLRALYWTPAQLLTHHASNGCNLQPGDLLGSGTVSGPEKENCGCLMELTRNGQESIALPTGERRAFLEDGDEIILRGYCERPGFVRIGLGECRGTVGSVC